MYSDGAVQGWPTAQDFYAVLGVGDDDKTISALDAAGISMAAIQELYRRAQEQKSQIEALEAQIRVLQGLVRQILSQERTWPSEKSSEE